MSFLVIEPREGDRVMRGIVTDDGLVSLVYDEVRPAAPELPYLRTSLGQMIRQRAGWLALLFVGEMLTASAMALYESELERAVLLAMFVPLIISSGGNSGSQATTLVIRAMALGELQPRDGWRVIGREVASGLSLGALLASLGVLRIVLWQVLFASYGPYWYLLAMTVGASLLGVVTWGTLCGSLLPLVIRRVGFDPASASAPFVATLVDVSGLLIYFSVAEVLLRGSLL